MFKNPLFFPKIFWASETKNFDSQLGFEIRLGSVTIIIIFKFLLFNFDIEFNSFSGSITALVIIVSSHISFRFSILSLNIFILRVYIRI